MKKSGVAVHPRTGKEIKVITLDTQIHKDQKTITWALKQEDVDNVKGRWATVSQYDLSGLTYRIENDTFKINNTIIELHDLYKPYSFLGSAWDTTDEDAVLLIAGLLRFQRIFGLDPNGSHKERAALLISLGVEISVEQKTPEPVWLIQQYYVPEKGRRSREIDLCLQKNLESFVDKIVLLNEKHENLPENRKLTEVILGHRLTYKDVIEYIYKEIPDGVRIIFSNADIWLDDWTQHYWSVDMADKFFALLRYENGTLFGPRADSQDCWSIDSSSVKRRKWDWAALNFPFGKMGCDNAIVTEMVRQKFKVSNPCLQFKTNHEHESNIRTYERTDIVDKPILIYVEPVGISDMEVYTEIGSFFKKTTEDGFERRLRSVDEKGLKTFISMINRQDGQAWSIDSANRFKEKAEGVYTFKNVFMTNTGLLYDYDGIYMGTSEEGKNAFMKTMIHPMTPVVKCNDIIAVPFTKESLVDYKFGFIQYIARVLQVRSVAKGEFWVGKGAIPWLELFEWNCKELPILQWDEHSGAYGSTGNWSGPRIGDVFYKSDVDILRKSLKGWTKAVSGEKVVIYGVDGAFPMIGGECLHYTTHSPEEIFEALNGASAIYYKSSDPCEYTWMMPLGAKVVEIQEEMDPQWKNIHMSGAAGLEHWLIFLKKGSQDLDEMIQKTKAAWKPPTAHLKKLEGPIVHSTKPVLILPDCEKTGFYGHAGDTFRELALLWEKAGYVQIVRDPRATLCWLGGIGKILLYDKDTLEWLDRAPLAEKEWTIGLFGNPTPPLGGKSWIFWGRRPELLEAMTPVALEDRKFGLVFYGKCENAVQLKRRKGEWQDVCDHFSMAIGNEPYKMSQADYLKMLGFARWGLCLPGYGYKCNREIECLGLGTVPVCTKDVDMNGYYEPLIEGVHYIRIRNPKDWVEPADDVWTRMSKAGREWWDRNASCAGSWTRTLELTRVLS